MANTCLLPVLGLLVSLTLLNHLISVNSQNLPVSGFFTFGDSTYDVGNKRFLSKATLIPSNTWPFGKSLDKPSGRWSDGRITPDFLAQFVGITNDIPPVLDPNGNVSRGASFAVADASVLGSPPESMSLNQQVVKFRAVKTNWDDKFLAQSLFLVYIGTEDYLNFTLSNPAADGSAQQAFVTSVINKLFGDVKLLYALGARKFAFQTLAPLGCFPIVKQDYKTGDKCLQILNDLAVQHNEKIRPTLDSLAKQLPGFQYTVFDFYEAMMRRFTSNMNYRFSEVNKACCGLGTHNAFGCGKPNVHSNLCNYQRSYLFFDGRHNTEKANEAFAHLFFGADPNVVGPMNLRELLVYPVGMNMLES